MKYFANIRTLDELKAAYRRLALKYHPDTGGSTEIMQEINNEHDALFEQLKRDPSYKGRITYWVTITRRMSDGTETDELREQYAGQERAKAFARFAALQKQYPGIASVKDIARRSWER